eukprot:TRINITY_DN39350_c0_g1_i1.p1 TRINITY_DN39350_c0_g1~~TRINITY_DN39350_c0_g1_i1.p1  ORF type:complete len:344 (-),score=51.91 TRINITY_DN39350_c0_g1_i1:117-1073(-)
MADFDDSVVLVEIANENAALPFRARHQNVPVRSSSSPLASASGASFPSHSDGHRNRFTLESSAASSAELNLADLERFVCTGESPGFDIDSALMSASHMDFELQAPASARTSAQLRQLRTDNGVLSSSSSVSIDESIGQGHGVVAFTAALRRSSRLLREGFDSLESFQMFARRTRRTTWSGYLVTPTSSMASTSHGVVATDTTGMQHVQSWNDEDIDEMLDQFEEETRSVHDVFAENSLPSRRGTSAAEHLLSEEEITMLPRVRFEGEHQNCAICLEVYTVGEFLNSLPCGHCFHSHCLARWLLKSLQCPLCRGLCTWL